MATDLTELHTAVVNTDNNPPTVHPDLDTDNWRSKGECMKTVIGAHEQTTWEKLRHDNPGYLRAHAEKTGLFKS